jgi:hypothetical protein
MAWLTNWHGSRMALESILLMFFMRFKKMQVVNVPAAILTSASQAIDLRIIQTLVAPRAFRPRLRTQVALLSLQSLLS